MGYLEDQKVINAMLDDVRKIQTKAYYFSSISGNSDMDKLDSMLLEFLRKYENKYIKF